MRLFQPWTMTATLQGDDRWTVTELADAVPALVDNAGDPDRGSQGRG